MNAESVGQAQDFGTGRVLVSVCPVVALWSEKY